ncbi:MAG TPA: GNAT family N-acetyltransferase [Chloroflexota bacterium]|nr:GNAT family N-acetyltransferase [Chloroflexota bacterium]
MDEPERGGSPVAFRRAIVADAAAIARVHAEGWRWGYRGLLPDAFLAGLLARPSLDHRETFWRALLGAEPRTHHTWVAVRDHRILGFCDTGPSRDSDATPGVAEIGALYLEEQAAGKGIGRALFATAIAGLKESGYVEATLWVLETNARARRFYEAAGWRPDSAKKTEPGPGVSLAEVRYRLPWGRE